MDEGFSFREAAVWLIALLWGALTVLARRTWNQHEERLGAIESQCKAEHKQRQQDLNQHAVADAGQHEAIKTHLAEEIRTLNIAINDTRREIKEDMKLIVGLIRGEQK
jgi:hypothetical protein